MADHQQRQHSTSSSVYKTEVFSILLRWSVPICTGISLVEVVGYLINPVWTLILLIVGFAVLSLISWWGLHRLRQGEMRRVAGVYLATAITLMGLVVLLTQRSLILEAAMGLAIFVLLAAFLEPSAALARWVAVSCLVYAAALFGRSVLHLPTIDFGPLEALFLYTIPPILLALTGILGRVIIQHLQRALQHSEAMRADLEQSYRRIEERTEELSAERTALQQTLEELRRTSEERTVLERTVEGLSTPILPVLERVLVMPIIGIVDEQRARQIQSTLLQAIQEQNARIVILDVTGLNSIDTFVMRALLAIVNGSRLLGGQPIIVGISPEVAEVIVSLGLPHQTFLAMANLQSALSYTLGR